MLEAVVCVGAVTNGVYLYISVSAWKMFDVNEECEFGTITDIDN